MYFCFRFCNLAFLVVGALASVQSHAECGENMPAKYHAVITFAGNNQIFRDEKWLPRDTFDDAIRASTEYFGRRARKDILLLGESRLGYFFYKKAWRPDPLPKNAIVLNASREDWLKAAQIVAQDFQSLRNKDTKFKPNEYQLFIHVTNHGDLFPGENGDQYGIVTGPRERAPIVEEDLREFARVLPPGIRVKLFFSQCYSSDTAQILLDHLIERDDRCSCGITGAAWGSEAYAGPAWERKVIAGLFQKPIAGVVSPSLSQINGNLDVRTSRLNRVYRFFMQHRLDIPVLAALRADHFGPSPGVFRYESDVVTNSAAILQNARALGPLGSDDRTALQREKSLAIEQLKEKLSAFKASEFEYLLAVPGIEKMPFTDPKLDLVRYVLALRNELSRPHVDELVVIRTHWETLQATAIWLQLYEAFLHFAPAVEKRTVRDLLLCESDPVGFF